MQRLLAAFLAAQLLGGCSFAFVKGPPENHRELETVDCSTSNAAPILDTLWTGLQTANLISTAASSDEEWEANFNGNPPMSRGAAIPVYIGLALLGGASMIYGYTRTGDCRRAKAAAQERLASAARDPAPEDDEPVVARPARAPAAGALAASPPAPTPTAPSMGSPAPAPGDAADAPAH